MIVGLEIEPSSVRAALVKKKGRYELVMWESFNLAQGILMTTGISDSEGFVKELAKIPSLFGIKHPKVAFCLSGPACSAVRILELPYFEDSEIKINLPLELDRYIPFSVKEVFFDYHILEKSKQTGKSRVIVAVALKELVNEYASAIERAGMIPEIADIGSLALHNVYEVNYNEETFVAVVNIGENVMNFNIVKGKSPCYIRDASNPLQSPSNTLSEDEIRDYGDDIAAEIYRQKEYFKTLPEGGEVEKIYITGIFASSPTFLQTLEERLNIPIHLFNPFKNIRISKDLISKMQNYSSVAAISVGLSLRGTEKIK